MKILIVDDDFTNRLVLQKYLEPYGVSHTSTNGREAVEAVRIALDEGEPYNLILMDIMMPGMDGQEAIRLIRAEEEKRKVLSPNRAKIVMTTALSGGRDIVEAFKGLCDAYVIKPIKQDKLYAELRKLGLLEEDAG